MVNNYEKCMIGNQEILISKSQIMIKRKGKRNYFQGNLPDLMLDIIELAGWG